MNASTDTLTDGQHATPMELALEKAVGDRISAILPPTPYDQNSISESTLAYLAHTLSADMWTAALADVEYRRQVVLDTIYIHRFRGTDAVIDRFADRAGFLISYVLKRNAGDTRNASVDVYITATVFERNRSDWVDYVAAVILRLLPLGITVNFISVYTDVRTDTYAGVVVRNKDLVVLSGGG